MRKGLISVLVLLLVVVVAGGGGLWYVGNEAENRFSAALERFSEPPSMALKKVSYQRNLFGAEAETALEMKLGPMTVAIPFKHTIRTAPFASGLAEVHTEMLVPPAYKPMVDAVFRGATPLTGDTVLGFDGTETTTFASPAFNLKEAASAAAWQGIKGTAKVQGTHVVMEANAPGLTVENPMFNVELSKLSFNGDMTKGADDIWLGSAAMQLAKMFIDTPVAPSSTAEGLRITSDTSEQAPGLLRSKVALDLKKFAFQELTFSNLGYEIELSNLDRAALVKLSKSMETMAVPTGGEPPAMGSLMTNLQPLLKRSPKVALKRLGAVTPWGDFKANATAVFDGNGDLPTEPMLWLARTNVQAKVDISATLLRWMVERQVKERAMAMAGAGRKPLDAAQADQLAANLASVRLTRLEHSGALVVNGDRYTIEINLADGAFTVNGKDVQQMAALMD